VHVETTAVAAARPRILEFTPERFRTLAVVAAGMLLLVVATGATVRLTASGLGCEHWPGCQPGDPFPKKGYHSYVEFSNRVVAFLTIVATLASWTWANLTPGVKPWLQGLAGWVFAGTLAQAPLGAITVYFHLNPWLVITHLLLSLTVLAGGIVVALQTFPRPPGTAPRLVAWGSVVPLIALGTLIVSGTVVTGSGPHPGGADVRRLGSFEPAIWLHVRATAVFGISFLALLVWTWRERARIGWALRAGALVLTLLVAQMVVGEVQYRTALPWWLVLVHVTLAASVWGSAVALVALLWRSRDARTLR
jgi:cytochrome c oxidase assembly protein subunit 15